MKNDSSGALALVSVDCERIPSGMNTELPAPVDKIDTRSMHTMRCSKWSASARIHFLFSFFFCVIWRLECVETGRFDLLCKRIEFSYV